MRAFRLRWFWLLLPLFFVSTVHCGEQTKLFNLGTDNIALDGYDPVSYHLGSSPTLGKKEFTAVYEGVKYRFANSDSQKLFNADPNKYLPAYGGWCAWAMLEGEKVKVNPNSFKIIAGVVYLFYDGFWGDTLKKWNEQTIKVSEDSLVKQSSDHWKKILSTQKK